MLKFVDYSLGIQAEKDILPIVRDFSLHVREGEILGLLGESGSGKTMAMTSMLSLVDSEVEMTRSGKVLFEGKDLLEMKSRQLRSLLGSEIAYIFQNALSAFDPNQTVGRQIRESLQVNRRPATDSEIEKMLEWVGIDEAKTVLGRYPSQLSGGMAQRLYIAMVLLAKPRLIIADEPTSSVDAVHKRRVLDLLNRINIRFGTTMVVITHDFDTVEYLCDRVAVMYGGMLFEVAEPERLSRAARHPYTQALAECVASLESGEERLSAIEGVPLGPRQYSKTSCPFFARCSVSKSLCSERMPEIEEEGQSWWRCHHPLGGESDE